MVFKEKFYIGYSDINKDFRISNTAVLKTFENVSCMHSTAVGDGMKTSESRWFLKAYHVRIIKRPEHEEQVTACTWSRQTKGVSASREFEIYDENGDLCITGISNWVRVNKELKPERITPEIFDCYESECDRTNFDNPWIDKLKETVKGGNVDAIKADTEALEKAFYAVSEKLYKQAGAQPGDANPGDGSQGADGTYYNTDFEDKTGK